MLLYWQNNKTLLHCAAQGGCSDLFTKLLTQGADVRAMDKVSDYYIVLLIQSFINNTNNYI